MPLTYKYLLSQTDSLDWDHWQFLDPAKCRNMQVYPDRVATWHITICVLELVPYTYPPGYIFYCLMYKIGITHTIAMAFVDVHMAEDLCDHETVKLALKLWDLQ